MLKPILARVRETVACYHQRLRTTDSFHSIQPGAWQRYEAVLRVLAPLGLSMNLLFVGKPMLGVPAAPAAPVAKEVQVAANAPVVYASMLGKRSSAKAKKARAKAAAARARKSSKRLASRSGYGMTSILRIINIVAREQGMDPALVRAVVHQESGYNPYSHSSAGAIGLMQLMPETAAHLGVNPWDPEQNIRGGVRFLKWLIGEFGSTRLAVAAYNAGPGAVKRYGGVPPYAETQDYVRKVLGYRAQGG